MVQKGNWLSYKKKQIFILKMAYTTITENTWKKKIFVLRKTDTKTWVRLYMKRREIIITITRRMYLHHLDFDGCALIAHLFPIHSFNNKYKYEYNVVLVHFRYINMLTTFNCLLNILSLWVMFCDINTHSTRCSIACKALSLLTFMSLKLIWNICTMAKVLVVGLLYLIIYLKTFFWIVV